MICFENIKIRTLLANGVRDGVFPGAALIVAHKGEMVFFETSGTTSFKTDPDPVTKDTIFDLASLTKPLATTLALMKLSDFGKINIDGTLRDFIPYRIPEDKSSLTLRQILCHCAGFVDWEPFYKTLIKSTYANRKKKLREIIMDLPLVYKPGAKTVYSDPGFMVLEWVIEECSGMPMDAFLDTYFFEPLCLEMFLMSKTTCHKYPVTLFAATEDCPWRKKIIQGEVHDDNAYVLGGFSGHAGLFGKPEDIYQLVNMIREHFYGKRHDFLNPSIVRSFLKRQCTPSESTWALGWDTPSETGSSAGKYFSGNSFGHLGFTGTSIWMDLDKDVLVILLTNRVHPTRENTKIRIFRPVIHDTVMENLHLTTF